MKDSTREQMIIALSQGEFYARFPHFEQLKEFLSELEIAVTIYGFCLDGTTLSHLEIAKKLGITKREVASAKRRAERRLKVLEAKIKEYGLELVRTENLENE